MLKKMRWRFIRAAMAAFFAVIFILLCGINLWNYQNTTQQQDRTLESLLTLNIREQRPLLSEEMPPPDGGLPFGDFSPEIKYMMRFFVVYCDASGEIERIDQDHIASVSDENAAAFAKQVLKREKANGYYEGYRYLVQHTDDGTVLIFLNSERELQSMKSLLFITGLVALCCLLVVFMLVLVFSRRAIAPYACNIETQKRFITNAGHELKTPLTAISTSADVLAMEIEENEWVKNIQFQSERMSILISDLIALSRLDEAQPLPNKTAFSLTDAIWELSESFAAAADANQKEYVQHIEENIQMFGDKSAIQQVVSILLDNAVKYTEPHGKIRLDVIRKQRKIEIAVYNTCQIQNYQDINRVFERFYRLEEARSPSNSYGLGLSIAKAIIENHNGTITAESPQGNSLLIRIRL